MTQGLVSMLIICFCIWLILDEFWGSGRIRKSVEKVMQ